MNNEDINNIILKIQDDIATEEEHEIIGNYILSLVESIANKMKGVISKDAKSEAAARAWLAIFLFDPNRGTRFSTYAGIRIEFAFEEDLSHLTGINKDTYNKYECILKTVEEVVSENSQYCQNLTQNEILIKAAKRLGGYEENGKIELDKFKINHKIGKQLRELINKKSLDDETTSLINMISEGKKPDKELIKKERDLIIHKSLEPLTEKRRQAIFFYYMDETEYTYEKIGVMMGGISAQTVKNHIDEGIKKLKEILNEEDIKDYFNEE